MSGILSGAVVATAGGAIAVITALSDKSAHPRSSGQLKEITGKPIKPQAGLPGSGVNRQKPVQVNTRF